MARKITIKKYYKPSLGKYVNQDGYDRKVNDLPEREKFEKSKIFTLNNEKEIKKAETFKAKLENKGLSVSVTTKGFDKVMISRKNALPLEKPNLGSKRWTMWAWDNGGWQERFTQTRDDRPKDSKTVMWLPYGDKPIQNKDNKFHEYTIAFDAGKPYEDYADSDRELRKKLEAFYVRNKGDDYPYDVVVFNSKGRDITEDQFITEMIAEIMEDNEE
jgi:hypothetical protein